MIYFNNAATSIVKPKEVEKAFLDNTNIISSNRSGFEGKKDSAFMTANARKTILQFINANDHDIAFTGGCTLALNQAIFGLFYSKRKRTSFHAIITQYEHNAVLRPIYELKKRGADITIISPDKNGKINISNIKKAIRIDTCLICAVYINNVTGAENDVNAIASLCQEHNITYLCDCAQAVGYFPVSLNNIHLAAFPAHKGLHAYSGTGALVIKKGIKLNPYVFGGTGTLSYMKEMPDFAPERYEAGTPNYGGIAAMAEGCKIAQNCDYQNRNAIQSYIFEELSKMKGIKILSQPNKCGIITFLCENNSDSNIVSSVLYENYDIVTRGGQHCAPLTHSYLGTENTGAVRISVDNYNTMNEAEEFIKAIYEINH